MRELKDIKVEKEVWKELTIYKLNKNFNNFSEAIKELLAYKNQATEQKLVEKIKEINPKNTNVFPLKKLKKEEIPQHNFGGEAKYHKRKEATK